MHRYLREKGENVREILSIRRNSNEIFDKRDQSISQRAHEVFNGFSGWPGFQHSNSSLLAPK